jgi:hypothetical protein
LNLEFVADQLVLALIKEPYAMSENETLDGF